MHKILSYFFLLRGSLVSEGLQGFQGASAMATTFQFARKAASQGFRLDPAIKEFLDVVVIPALVEAYLLESAAQNPLATVPEGVPHSVSKGPILAEGVS